MIKTRVPEPKSSDANDLRKTITIDLLKWMGNVARSTPIDIDDHTIASYKMALSGMLSCLGWKNYDLDVFARHSGISSSGRDEVRILCSFESDELIDSFHLDIVVTL